jgi:kynureninase
MPKGTDMEAGKQQQQLDFAEREVVLRANLDEVDADRCVWASMRFLMNGPRHPRLGELVFLIDGARGGSMGSVVELNGWMTRVRLLPEQAHV